MRVYGLKSPVRNLAWLLGGLLFLLAVLYPPFSRSMSYSGYSTGVTFASWMSGILSVLATGGPVWHILSYLRWQSLAQIPATGRDIFSEFAPSCFIPLLLPFCSILLWRWLVYNAENPTIIRGLLAVLLALVSSLFLTFLLDEIGGRILLSILSLSGRGNLEARGLMATVWDTSLAQFMLLLIPCLVVGGMLAWWQRRLVVRYMGRNPGSSRQG